MLQDAAEDLKVEAANMIRSGAWGEVGVTIEFSAGKPERYRTTRVKTRKTQNDPR